MWLYSDTPPKGQQSQSISRLSHPKPRTPSESVKALTFAVPAELRWVFCAFKKKTAEIVLKSKTEERSGVEIHISDRQ